MKKPVLFLSLLTLFIITLTIVQIVVSNNLSTKGVSLGKLEDEIRAYKKENTLLREKMLTLASFTNVASKAAELGLTTQKSEVYLNASVPLAIR